jgi:hypothetical protein
MDLESFIIRMEIHMKVTGKIINMMGSGKYMIKIEM